MKKKILILGSEGLIGSDLSTFLSDKYDVFKIDLNIKNSNNTFKVNLNHPKKVENIFNLFSKKKIYFHSIINSIYPKRKASYKNFLDFDVQNYQKDLTFHLVPFYSILLNSYNYYKKINKKGQVISLGSIYGLKIPNFKIYKNTNIRSPIMYSSSKAALSIMTKYFSRWSRYHKMNICFSCINPAGVKDTQSIVFQKNYKRIYKAEMLCKRTVSKKILNVMKKPKIYDGKDVLVTNGIVFQH